MAGGGGKKGGSGGGVTPEQEALAQYTFGQHEVANSQAFSSVPMSTMHAQADAGAFADEAKSLAQISDADANAQAAQQAAGKSALSSGIGSIGSLLGGGGGGGG